MNAAKKKFIETIQRYQDVEREFEKNHRQRIERQILIGKTNKKKVIYVQYYIQLFFLKIVKPEATPDEIESAINSDEALQIFAHSVSHSCYTRIRNVFKITRVFFLAFKFYPDRQCKPSIR